MADFTRDQQRAMAIADARRRAKAADTKIISEQDDGQNVLSNRAPRDLLAGKMREPRDLLAERSTGSRMFTITAPDGRKYRVTGENEQGALNALRKHLGDTDGPKPRFNGIPVGKGPRFDGIPVEQDPVPTSSGEAFRRSFVDGMPIVGPMLRGGAERLAAGVVAAIDPNRTYDDVRASQQERSEELSANHPIASTAGQLSGSVAGTIPLVAAAPAAFGASGGGLLARTTASGISGSALGASDAAVRSGGDLEAIESGAAWGGVTGLAGPVAGDLIGSGFRTAGNLFRSNPAPGVPRGAVRAFSRAATDDGLDAATAAARFQELGPDALPVDLGPNLQRQAGALAAEQGEAQQIIRQAMAQRDAGANARILSDLDDTLGRASVPSAVDDSLAASQRSLSPMYQNALSGASAVDTSAIAQGLDDAAIGLRGDAQSAVHQVRKMLNVTGSDALDSNPSTLLATRQAIDDMLGSPSMGGNAARVLRDVRNQVDQVLADAVPGLKSIDARYQELARQRTALEDGARLLDGGRTAMRPQELADDLAEGVQPRGELIGPSAAPMRMREGARAEIERIVGTNGNDRIKLERLIGGEGDWNRAKLAMLFGKDKSERILRVLARERQFAETSAIVTRNSETAARTAARDEITSRSATGLSVKEMAALGGVAGGSWGAAAAAGAKLADKGISSVVEALQARGNRALAELLAGKSGKTAAREQIIKILMDREARKRGLNPAARMLIDSTLRGPATNYGQRLPAPSRFISSGTR